MRPLLIIPLLIRVNKTFVSDIKLVSISSHTVLVSEQPSIAVWGKMVDKREEYTSLVVCLVSLL